MIQGNEEDTKPSFWLLHASGWIGYIIIFSFDNLLFTVKPSHYSIIIPLTCSALIAATCTLPLRYIYRRFLNISVRHLILFIVCVSFLIALIWTPSKNFTMMHYNLIINPEMVMKKQALSEGNIWVYLDGLSYSFFMILIWSVLYFAITFHFRLKREQKMHLQAARLSHLAQIKMLRYQINPHFLFNTLNAISTLVMMGNKQKANGMLVRLSTFLRFSLDSDPEKKVMLCDEIKTLMLYLEIEKMRFDERLTIELNIEENAETLLVPSLLLQPLVENSIKYAIAKMPAGGIIKIDAFCQYSNLIIEVSDNGPCKTIDTSSKSQSSASGVGIQNIKNRLEVLYPATHKFNISINQPSGYKVSISIPMEGT